MNFEDIQQNDRLKKLENERYIGRMESRILRRIVGQECTLKIDYSEIRCKIIDVDELFVMLQIYQKKNSITVIRRVSEINSITLDKDFI